MKFHLGMDEVWILIIGSLVAASCSLVGCFLVLRRLAMLGDAISHAVLPGIVAAFFLTHSRNTIPMMLGAGTLGLLTAFITQFLSKSGKLQEDASIGVTFTWLFAVGVILISKYASQVDLDLDCVLYGEIAFAPFDVFTGPGGGSMGPRAAWIVGFALIANFAFVILCYKQLKICAFDPALAASLGLNVALWHYLLMAFVSMTTVASFESVGAILVVAMLIVPPNTAFLLTQRLSTMLAVSVLVGVASALGGYALAAKLDGSIAGAMATVAGGFFALAAIFSPTRGFVAHMRRRRAVAEEPLPAIAPN